MNLVNHNNTHTFAITLTDNECCDPRVVNMALGKLRKKVQHYAQTKSIELEQYHAAIQQIHNIALQAQQLAQDTL